MSTNPIAPAWPPLVAGLVALAIGLTGCSATSDAPTAPATPTNDPGGGVPGSPVTPRAPEPADLRIDVIILSKQCVSPASCVYHYAIDPWPTATFPPQPSGRKLTVIYTVTGGDQSQIGNYTIDYTGDHKGDVYRDTDTMVVGPDNAVLVATPTQIVVEGVS